MSIKVSVIIPTYNGDKTLNGTIISVLNQTLQEIEIIISDDVSKDNTRKIIEDFSQKYPDKIRYIFMKQNSRGSGVINEGVKAAKGKYIAIIDQDDWMDSSMLEKL